MRAFKQTYKNASISCTKINVHISSVLNPSPVFSSLANFETPENVEFQFQVTASPVDSYEILETGDYFVLFSINPSTGLVTFLAQDYETPVDENTDNVYNITVRAIKGSQYAEQEISVTVTDVEESESVTSVSLAPSNVWGIADDEIQLTATVLPSNATDKSVIWSSDDEAVATVSSSGLVTLVARGTCTITVTTTDGSFTDTCGVQTFLIDASNLEMTSAEVDALLAELATVNGLAYLATLNTPTIDLRGNDARTSGSDTDFNTIRAAGVQILEDDEFDELAPSGLALTVVDETSIQLDWTNNSSNAEGISIERSTDGVTYAEIDTVSSEIDTYTDTTGTEGTRYYYQLKAYNGTTYSAASTAANDWTAIKMVLASTGTGAGVTTFKATFAATDVVVTLDGNGKWYSDSGGTADESASYTFVSGAERIRYLKVTSGSSNMLIFAKGNWTNWSGWISSTNAVTIAKNIANLTTLTQITCTGNNTLSGSLAGLTSLTYLDIRGLNTVTGSINSLTSLTYLVLFGSNTVTGDISAIINGITTINTIVNRFVDYTAGATWTLTQTSVISPSTGYGYSSTEIDNMLIDMAASLGTVTAKTITLQGSSSARTSASDSAVTTLNGKGWTVVTN